MKISLDLSHATLDDVEDAICLLRARADRLAPRAIPENGLQRLIDRTIEDDAPVPQHQPPLPLHPAPALAEAEVEAEGSSRTSDEPDAEDIDIHGDVWDAAVHSAGKSKNADGSWRRKRGAPPRVDPGASHEAENMQCISERELVEYISKCVVDEKISAVSTREVLKSHGLEGTILDIYKTTGDVRNAIYDSVKRLAEGVSDD